MKITNAIDIQSTREKVFSYIEDPERTMEWMTSVSKGEIIEKTPDMVGTTFVETVEDENGSTELRGSITEFVAGESMAFHLEGDYNTVDVRFSLEEIGGIIRVTQIAKVRFKGLLTVMSVLLRPVFKKKLRDQSNEEFQKLKGLCEGND